MLQAMSCVAVGSGFQVAGDGLCSCRWWVLSCRRRAVWLSVVGSKLQEGGCRLWVDDAPVGSGLLTVA